MATPAKIQLSATQQPEFGLQGITSEATETTSRLLQENHEKHHIFFNNSGFHNHIVHHLLTVFALAASPETIQKQYDVNQSYQRPLGPVDTFIVEDLHNPATFKKYLGDNKRYPDFLRFFKEEMEKKGWENVLNEYVFGGGEICDDMLVRLFAGFLHPIIHLGFGLEFKQPAIIAEALAQAAIHEFWLAPFFFNSEKAAKQNGNPDKTLVSLLEDIRADKKLSSAAHWDDGNKIRDGILARAGEEMVKYASQYVVPEERLEEKTAEMINAAIFYTGAAQHPPHHVKFDFYYMHCVNSSLWFPTFMSLPFLSTQAKVRLLEWKSRIDLTMYASRHCPALLLDEIKFYVPSGKTQNDGWDKLFERARQFEDDGHTSKLVRSLAHGEKVCKGYEGREGFKVEGDMWVRLGNMAMDSVKPELGDIWVRSAGFEEAWEEVPLRDGSKM